MVQQNAAGNPFNVEVFGGVVRGAMAGSIFINDAGVLRIDDLQVIDAMAMSFVSTANLGTTFIEGVEVLSSSIEVSTT